MGIRPLFRPKTGIKIKLCSLKYTPSTETAVSENLIRIRFIPKVMTEVMDCMTIEGTPTV